MLTSRIAGLWMWLLVTKTVVFSSSSRAKARHGVNSMRSSKTAKEKWSLSLSLDVLWVPSQGSRKVLAVLWQLVMWSVLCVAAWQLTSVQATWVCIAEFCFGSTAVSSAGYLKLSCSVLTAGIVVTGHEKSTTRCIKWNLPRCEAFRVGGTKGKTQVWSDFNFFCVNLMAAQLSRLPDTWVALGSTCMLMS